MEDRMRTRGAAVMGSNLRTHAPTIVFEFRVKGHVSIEIIHLASYSC